MSTITAANVSLLNKMNQIAKKVGLGTLLNSYAGSHKILAASNTFATSAGSATQTISVPGVTSSDIAIVQIKTVGATPRTIVSSTTTTDAITVTMSGDPSTDHVLKYVVLRVVS